MWGRRRRAAVAAAVTPALLAAEWDADELAAALRAAGARRGHEVDVGGEVHVVE